MRRSDHDPISAYFSGIQSGLGRLVVVWLVLAEGVALPMVPHEGVRVTLSMLFMWPFVALFGIVGMGAAPVPLCFGALLVPLGLLAAAWGFLTDNSPKFSLWLLFSLSMTLTVGVFDPSPGLFGVLGLWGVLSLAYFLLPRWFVVDE